MAAAIDLQGISCRRIDGTGVIGAVSGIVIIGAFEVGTRGMHRSVDGLCKIEGVPRAVTRV